MTREDIMNLDLNQRVEQNVIECYDEDTGEFDWEEYDYLCRIAEYWDCDE